MAHSVELLFDPDTDAAIRRQWTALAAAGLPSLAHHRSPTNRPHVTLTAAQRIGPAADGALAGLAGLLPIPCVIGALVVFGRQKVSLVRLVLPSQDLLELHRSVSERVVPQTSSGAYPHTLPGDWTPHVSLCRRLPAEQLPAALDVIVAESIEGTLVGLRRWDGDARVDHLLV